MKRVYITPEIKTIQVSLLHICAGSPNTGWQMGDDPIGGDQPDPNADSRYEDESMWDEDEE